MAKKSSSSNDIDYNTQTILVVLLLIFVYPVGLILMFIWMKWPQWVKILVTSPIIISIFMFFLILLFGILGITNRLAGPTKEEAYTNTCLDICKNADDHTTCMDTCKQNFHITPGE